MKQTGSMLFSFLLKDRVLDNYSYPKQEHTVPNIFDTYYFRGNIQKCQVLFENGLQN